MDQDPSEVMPTSIGRARRWAVVGAKALAWGFYLALVLAIIGAPLASWIWGAPRLRSAIDAADASDLNWRLADLLASREAVPEAEDGAIAVAEAASMLPRGWPPPLTPQEPNCGPRLRDAFDRARKAVGPERVDDETLAVLRCDLEARADALAAARRVVGFVRGFHEFVPGRSVIDVEHAESESARRVARLLQADAIVAAHEGRSDDAVLACRAILGVGRSIGDEPTSIPQLVRSAIDGAAVDVLVAVLARGEPSTDSLAATQNDLLAALAEPIERHAFRGDRAVWFELIERLKEDPFQFSPREDGKTPPAPWVAAVGSAYLSPILAGQGAVMLEWRNEVAAIVERPTIQWLPAVEARKARVEARKASRIGSLTGLLAILLDPSDEPAFHAFLRRRGRLGAATILLAAERQRRRTGEWPTAIAEIPRDILPEPPIDPYTGHAYRGVRVDGGWRVYSVGPNCKDEGGACEEKKRGKDGAADDVGVIGHDPDCRGRVPADVEGFTPGPAEDNVYLKVKNSDSNPMRRDPG